MLELHRASPWLRCRKHCFPEGNGTFFRNDEIKSRNIKNIPHPPIEKTIKILNYLELAQRKKIFFTHLNHTNSVLDKTSNEYRGLIDLGFNVAEDGQEFSF